ncbi:hypothetical protein [Leptospira barantonii]|uniref:hypothetical protein n=1 Tax=Leptospira barantonii TaxID=2023184 RepID=UPI001AEFCFD7|nr:hypothetical protein [Leptospira barantonii]
MSIQNKIQNYFLRNVNLFTFVAPAWIWFLSLIGAIFTLAVFSYGVLELGLKNASSSEFMVFVFFGGLAILFLLLFSLLIYSLFPNYKPFLIFTLIISAICFSTNSYVLNHEVFPPFTERTVWVLWISFSILALSFFMDKIPSIVLPFFQPILILGVFVSTSFALVLAPLMIFSWALVWMAGLGFLPYGPLFAITAFGQAIFKIHSSLDDKLKRISSGLIFGTAILFISYSAYYFVQWNHAEHILSKPETIQGRFEEEFSL